MTDAFLLAGTLLLVLTLAAAPAVAAEYHVDPAGDDAAAGSAAAPFRTISRAAGAMKAGDVCVVHGGTYRETVAPSADGREDAPICFKAAEGDVVTVTGTEPVSGWARHDGETYVASVAEPVEEVFVDGRMMTYARYPNATDDPFKPRLLELTAEEGRLVGDGLDQPADFWKGGTVWGLDARLGWVAQKRPITSSGPGYVGVGGKKAWWGAGKGRAYLEGVLGALDAPGEWFQADGKLYLLAPGGGDPSRHTVEVTRRRFAFDLAGRRFVRIEGFRVFAASLNFDGAEQCTAARLRVRYPCTERDIRGGFNRDRGMTSETEGLGIVLAGKGNTLRDSIVSHSNGDGVSIFGEENTLENCLVHDCDFSASDCAPVNVTGEGHVIRRCTLYNGARSILVHRKLVHGRIEHNDMHDAGLMTNDLGMTYTYQTDGDGTVIAFNRIHHNWANGFGCVGIYLDDLTRGHVVHHNLVYKVSEAMAMNPPDSQRNLVTNNTLDGFRAGLGMSRRRPQDMTGSRIVNNIFTHPAAEGPNGRYDHNLVPPTDPKFTDRAAGDYTLRAGSPAIDAGAAVPPYTDGFAGEAPDQGAFEFGREPWTAGCSLEEDPAWVTGAEGLNGGRVIDAE